MQNRTSEKHVKIHTKSTKTENYVNTCQNEHPKKNIIPHVKKNKITENIVKTHRNATITKAFKNTYKIEHDKTSYKNQTSENNEKTHIKFDKHDKTT